MSTLRRRNSGIPIPALNSKSLLSLRAVGMCPAPRPASGGFRQFNQEPITK